MINIDIYKVNKEKKTEYKKLYSQKHDKSPSAIQDRKEKMLGERKEIRAKYHELYSYNKQGQKS